MVWIRSTNKFRTKPLPLEMELDWNNTNRDLLNLDDMINLNYNAKLEDIKQDL